LKAQRTHHHREKGLNKRSIVALALCAGCASAPALAANAADEAATVQRLQREQIDRVLQDRKLEKTPHTPQIALPPTPAPSAESQQRNIRVKSFQVDASAILEPAAIQRVLAPYAGKTVSLAELLDAVAKINALYDAKHMPTARAILPPQSIHDGIVHIRLIEARVGAIEIGALTEITPAFVLSRLRLGAGDLMSVPLLEADLLRFNRLHDVQLHASVAPGKAAATTDIRLAAVEPPRYQFSLFADNAGRYTVGDQRVGLSAQVAGLTRHGDNLQFTAVKSRGSDSYFLGYALPLSADDLRLDVSYSQGSIEVVNGSFVPLDVSGSSNEFAVGLSYPLRVDAHGVWSVYGRASTKAASSEFGGASQQDVNLLVFSAGVTGQQQSAASAWTFDASLNQGVRTCGGEVRFTAWRASGAWLAHLDPRADLVLRGGVQYSQTALLPSAEQFQLGGSASVRGYSEGLLSGISGYLTSAELRYALQDPQTAATRAPAMPQLTGLVFLDHGGAFPYRPAPLAAINQNDFLTGVGVGVQMDWHAGISARVAVAWPLADNPAETQQREPRLHATIAYTWP
jgi:hemolysin activation/secretion protein